MVFHFQAPAHVTLGTIILFSSVNWYSLIRDEELTYISTLFFMWRLMCVFNTILSCACLDGSHRRTIACTTGIGHFTEWLPGKHSTKSLPSVTLDKESSTNCTSQWLLSRVLFIEHSVLGKEKSPSRHLVTETAPLPSVLGDTRQRVHQRAPLSVSLLSAIGGTR
jgi:hypothetical protein